MDWNNSLRDCYRPLRMGLRARQRPPILENIRSPRASTPLPSKRRRASPAHCCSPRASFPAPQDSVAYELSPFRLRWCNSITSGPWNASPMFVRLWIAHQLRPGSSDMAVSTALVTSMQVHMVALARSAKVGTPAVVPAMLSGSIPVVCLI